MTMNSFCARILSAFLLSSAALLSGAEAFLPPETAVPSRDLLKASDLNWKSPSGIEVKLADFTKTRSLDANWKFLGPENSLVPFSETDINDPRFKSDYDDSKWTELAVPLNWYAKYKTALDKSKPFVQGFYRHSFNLDASEIENKRVILHFGVAAYEADLFVNGKSAGSHHGDFTPWDADISELVKSGINTIALRLRSDFGTAHGGLKKAVHVYGSQWSISSIKAGLWQSVSLRFESPVYFSRILVSPELKSDSIRVDYQAENRTEKNLSVSLEAAVLSSEKKKSSLVLTLKKTESINLMPGSNKGTFILKLKDIEKWSPENPALYFLSLALGADGKAVAASAVRFGYRDFKAENNAFYLNGKRIYLYGDNFPSSRYEGDGLSPEKARTVLETELKGYKRLGYNIVRNAHAPTSPSLYEIADEIGIMIYDEWGWSFTKSIDEPAFEKNNLAEIEEWIYRDYNYPSVVMWSCGNEVVFKGNEAVARQLDKQYDLVKKLDLSGRPASTFSGAGLWSHYGEERRKTDVIDLHHYLGASGPVAWTCWNEEFNKYYSKTAEVYADNGKFSMPYIIWECVGYSWGSLLDKDFKLNDINLYASYAEKKTEWGNPNGIGYAGTIGLAAALDPERGINYGKKLVGKRMLELMRQDSRIQGFAPWFHGSYLDAARTWTQPLLAGLRDSQGLPPRNLFNSKEYPLTVWISNNTDATLNNPVLDFFILTEKGEKLASASFKLGTSDSWKLFTQNLKLDLSSVKEAGKYQLRISLREGDKELSRNFYDVFIAPESVLISPVKTNLPVMLAGNQSFTAILEKMSVKAELMKPTDLEGRKGLLVIAPYSSAELDMNAVYRWAEKGGIVLILEQKAGELALPDGRKIQQYQNSFTDIAIPEHPIFKGLSQSNFDTWTNVDHGLLVNAAFSPFSTDTIAVAGPFLGSKFVGSTVVEGFYGKGRILSSQLLASSAWGKDSAASIYLKNLIAYMSSGEAYKKTQNLKMSKNVIFSVKKESLVFFDLKSQVNKSFSDSVANDGKGGWTDQGENDLSMMKSGVQTLAGVNFDIIDPAKNNDKSCIVLRGTMRPDFPTEAKGIKIGGKFSRLFFLHACAWGKGKEAGTYLLRYSDGTEVFCELEEGRNTGDWWQCASLPEAKLAFSAANKTGKDVGFFAMEWENPYPEKEIKELDFLSAGRRNADAVDFIQPESAVPILLAVTGEKANPAAVKLSTKDGSSVWKTVNKENPRKAIAELMQGEADMIAAPVKVTLPLQDEKGVPALMARFSADAVEQGKCSSIVFWVKSNERVQISLTIPEKNWGARRIATVFSPSKEWKKIRLSLKEDFPLVGKKDFSLSESRGEIFITNSAQDKDIVFCISNPYFE